MGEILAAIATFLKLNARTAFALFAAGATILLFIRLKWISNDPAELAISYIAAFALYTLIAVLAEATAQKVTEWRMARAKAARAVAQADADRKLALSNLRHVEDAEANALAWIYHNDLQRLRTSQHFDEIANLVRMKILVIEDHNLPYHDRFFIVPDYVDQKLHEIFKQRKPDRQNKKPPWVRSNWV